jgi:hypothetical protein
MAFVSELVSADCTLRHVYSISYKVAEVTLLHVPKKLLIILVMSCKHLESGLSAPISMGRMFAPTPLLQSSH